MTGLAADVLATLAEATSRLVENLRRSVVVVHSASGYGSGLIWGGGELIVTNHHVLARPQAKVELFDGRRLTAEVVARDPYNDLAALSVGAKDLSAALIGDSRALRVGELIIAVGHPFGVRGSTALGIVSAVGKATWIGQTQRELLLANVLLAPGNSGGPLANLAGHVVGIASMVLSSRIALVIPSHVVNRFIATLSPK
ncbi:MAG: S1C family serine protease [Anaerolineae bacterium]